MGPLSEQLREKGKKWRRSSEISKSDGLSGKSKKGGGNTIDRGCLSTATGGRKVGGNRSCSPPSYYNKSPLIIILQKMENNSGDRITPLLDYENATNGLNDNNTTSTNSGFILSRNRVVFLITGLLIVALVVVAYVCLSANDVPLCASNEALKAVAGGDLLYRRRVPRGVLEGFSLKSNDPLKEDVQASGEWSRDMLNWQKSGFHFQPKKNWMNDPCGPLYYKGNYHIFYQYNPGQAVWGNITWGHAISKDLIHWDELPLAFEPSEWYDVGGIFTGSATVLPDGRLIMLFTGADKYGEQLQNLAYPADPSDDLLIKWTKYPGNPILRHPPGVGPTDYRDPTTAWLTSEGKWRISIGSKYNRTGIVFVYDTTDFINCKLKDTLLHSVEGVGMWECVDFFPVSTTSDDGLDVSYNGTNIKHVMKASMDDDRYDTYAGGLVLSVYQFFLPTASLN
ncbi:hypothetical protein Leryth_016962 [Lithospermum erythrorhizon]|nr:hypothetical protein Leryth_016962 [Lithospermum erythrorhizon]